MRPLQQVSFFDTDTDAMDKLAANLSVQPFTLTRATSIHAAMQHADIVVTATAAKQHGQLIEAAMLQPGQCVLALGGDCPGKTEFTKAAIERCRVVVEYLPQSLIEGEIQQLGADAAWAELWELVSGQKTIEQRNDEIMLFDSVGFAMEDFSLLKLLYLAIQRGELVPTGELNMIPTPQNPKDLYGLIRQQ